MEAFRSKSKSLDRLHSLQGYECNRIRKRLRKWQQVRTWARLIREAESLWRVDVRDLRRIGAIELSQLIEEVPPSHRRRVNRWLVKYSVSTRFY